MNIFVIIMAAAYTIILFCMLWFAPVKQPHLAGYEVGFCSTLHNGDQKAIDSCIEDYNYYHNRSK